LFSFFENDLLRQGRYFFLAGLVLLVILSQGCSSLARHNTLPASLEDEAQIPGLPGVRGWGASPARP
jgi:hypothetical protein